MIEFELDERRDSGSGERSLIAAALLLWVQEIVSDERRTPVGDAFRRFAQWDRHGRPERFDLFCHLLDMEPAVIERGVWMEIARQRDEGLTPGQQRAADRRRHYDEAVAAGMCYADARQYARLMMADAAA